MTATGREAFDDAPAIARLDRTLEPALRRKLDSLTKPPGSLGRLEAIALQVGLIQGRLDPVIERPVIVVFAGDHGLAETGVSPYPQAVTAQMVQNFLRGGAAINVLCRTHGLGLKIVNAGVDARFAAHPDLIDRPIAAGTRNSLREPAMSIEQAERALTIGAEVVAHLADEGSNLLGFGEMGIGNSSSAALIMARLTGLPLCECAGRGTGLDDAGLARKLDILGQVLDCHAPAEQPLEVLAAFGGFEIGMMVGAYREAARRGLLILVDGFIATAALLLASRLTPAVLDYCIFSHCSDENGHRKLLRMLGGDHLLHLSMRLGEGSGAATAFPLLKAAVALLNDMASFDAAGVSERVFA